jgi:hypothetical protein
MPQKYLQKGQGRRMWLKPLPLNDLQHLWAVFHMFSLPIEQISISHVAQMYYSMQYKTHDEPATSDRHTISNTPRTVANSMTPLKINQKLDHCIRDAWISHIKLLPEEIFNPICDTMEVQFQDNRLEMQKFNAS